MSANHMLKEYESVNKRRVLYLDIEKDLAELQALDLYNWAVYVIEDDPKNPLLIPFADLCIKKNVVYMTATGTACSIVDDIFDEIFVNLEISGVDLPDWKYSEEQILMTCWNYNFGKGFWFISTVATNDDIPIDTILVANLTRLDRSSEIKQLVQDINNGWLPED